MATRTISNSGGNWNATGTWAESAVPTAADDVVATATSGAVTITAAAVCRSIDLTGYTSTLIHNAFTLTIGTSTANGTKALIFPASGWTYTLTDAINSAISFTSSVASTVQTIDFGGKTTGNVTFSAAASSGYQLVNHGFSTAISTSVAHIQGSLDTNGQSCSWGSFGSNTSNTRSVSLGSSSITLNSTATAWNIVTTTGLTFNAGTSTITFVGSSASFLTTTMNAANLTYNTVVFALGSSAQFGALNGTGSGPTFANLTVTGPANTNAVLSLGTNITVTTALTLNGSNANTNRLLINSAAIGSAHTITNNGTGSFSNLDLQDITGAGSASWNLSVITGNSGDCLGNSGITFTTARTLYWVGNSGSWSTANSWATSSGGTGNQSNPLAQDTITFDSHSFSAGGQSINCNMPRAGAGIDFTNATNNPTIICSLSTVRLYGSLTLIPGMGQSGSGAFQFEGRSNFSFTTGGSTLTYAITVAMPGGTLTLSGDLTTTVASSSLALRAGTFTTVSNNVTVKVVSIANNVISKTLNMGSGTWTLNGTGTVWNTAPSANFTLNAQTSTILISDTTATAKTFNANNGFTYNNLTISGDNVTIAFANTFNNLSLNNGGRPTGTLLASGQTQTLTGALTTNGSSGNLAILAATSAGTAATLSKASGIVSVDYISIKDSNASGGATWYAGANSLNISDNSGWIFSAPPLVWTGGWGIPIK